MAIALAGTIRNCDQVSSFSSCPTLPPTSPVATVSGRAANLLSHPFIGGSAHGSQLPRGVSSLAGE
jgi:hypothetical protein